VRLLPWQALSLAEAVECEGAFLALPLGQGKTLLTFLLPTLLQSRRALLCVPGALREKTHADFQALSRSWRSPPPIRVETRERLSVVSGAELLREYRPDLIMLDEADDFSNTRSAAVRRLDRYIMEYRPMVVTLTGTPSRKSIMAYWHLLWWALGDGAPLPSIEGEAKMWALALDDHRGPRPEYGPLGVSLRTSREWYRRRLVETPGVVVVDEDSCDVPLTVRIRLAREDPILDSAYARFLLDYENPGGVPVSDPLSRWLLDGQLGLGLYTRWDPEPPEAWRDARRQVARFVRGEIARSSGWARPLDTELQVLRRYADKPVVREWQAIRPTWEGVTETVWITRSALDSCHDWLSETPRGQAIVWCGSIEFARALSREAGLPYYGQGGRALDGSGLHEAAPGRSLVASWNANKKGFNLQPWPYQLVAMPPQSAKWLEQIFGRSHRRGQTEPVTVDVLATSGGTLDLFEAALSEAETVRDRDSMTQKILRAKIVRAKPRIAGGNDYRWATRT
jgi:hypothetical protein